MVKDGTQFPGSARGGWKVRWGLQEEELEPEASGVGTCGAGGQTWTSGEMPALGKCIGNGLQRRGRQGPR